MKYEVGWLSHKYKGDEKLCGRKCRWYSNI